MGHSPRPINTIDTHHATASAPPAVRGRHPTTAAGVTDSTLRGRQKHAGATLDRGTSVAPPRFA
jgi:hypothetical protein